MGVGWGMQWELVLLIVVIVECLLILRGLVELSRSIDEGLAELDSSLAEAIASVVSQFSAGGSLEPVNPIQAALAQLLTSQVQKQAPGGAQGVVEVLSRDASGKFEKSS